MRKVFQLLVIAVVLIGLSQTFAIPAEGNGGTTSYSTFSTHATTAPSSVTTSYTTIYTTMISTSTSGSLIVTVTSVIPLTVTIVRTILISTTVTKGDLGWVDEYLPVVQLVAAIVVICGALAGFVKWVLPRIRQRGKETADSGRTAQTDFRNKIVDEVLEITNHIIMSTDSSRISCPAWVSQTEDAKARLLGGDDYGRCRKFYDAVEARNQYRLGKRSLGPWENFAKLNTAIYDAFLELHAKLPWVRESILETTFNDLRKAASESANVSVKRSWQ